MTQAQIDILCKLAYGACGHFDNDVTIKRSELQAMLNYIKIAEKRHLKKVTRFRRACEGDFNIEHLRPNFAFDQTDETLMAYAKRDRIIIYSSAGLLVMQSGSGESGLFPGSLVTQWKDTETVETFNG